MRKHIGFAITATIVGLAMVFWFKANVVETNAAVVRTAILAALLSADSLARNSIVMPQLLD